MRVIKGNKNKVIYSILMSNRWIAINIGWNGGKYT